MNTTMLIILVVYFILTLTFAIVCGKRWNVANAVLLFFVSWAALEFFYISGHALKLHDKYRSEANRIEAKLADVRAEIKMLEFGSQDVGEGETSEENSGVRELRQKLHRLTLDRGRVWSNCQADPQADENGQVTIRIENPVPHGIEVDSLLYAFEQGPASEDNRFLSLSKVVEVGEGMIKALPLRPFTPEQLNEALNRDKLWRLYESLPVDRHDLLTSLSEEELRAGLPEQTIDEYLKDGKEAAPDDPEERQIGLKADGMQALPDELDQVVKRLYVRRLRDYAFRFEKLYEEQTIMQSDIDRENSHIAAMQESLDQAEANVQAREAERTKLDADLVKFRTEVERVDRHLAALEQQRGSLDRLIGEKRAEAAEMATRLARWQADATERIDRATNSQAAAAP